MHIFLKFHLQCITSEGVPPSWHSMRPWPHLQFNFFRQWPISEGVFRSKTRHPTAHTFWCWHRHQSSLLPLLLCQPRSSFVSTWLPRGCVDTSSHQLSASCNIASSFVRAVDVHGQTPARADYSRVGTHRPPFVRCHYCRTPTTTQLYQFHIVCVIVCATKETIFLLSKTLVSSGSATNSHRNLTDFFIIVL